MSKEDILYKQEPSDDAGVFRDEQIYIAMDEWAKQQIISYEIWLEAELNNDISFNYGKTPEQLYDLFLQSQNKEK